MARVPMALPVEICHDESDPSPGVVRGCPNLTSVVVSGVQNDNVVIGEVIDEAVDFVDPA